MSYIEFKNINKYYGENQVLKDISLNIEKGQFVTLLGPSGCGKSTLLRCLSGLETISSGRIFMDGEDITDVEPKNRNIGMVFQHYSLFPNMTVEENIAFGLKMKKRPEEEIREKVKSAME
ncbi:MAG: ABC transporter ATP-binding protein, partial [Candidatus Ornithomonoglobus sp.]